MTTGYVHCTNGGAACQVVTRALLKTLTHRECIGGVVTTICYMTSRVRLDIDAIGGRAARQRDLLHLEQEEVALKSGMSRAYISRLENGGVRNPKVADLAAVAEALGLSLDSLIYGRPSETDVDVDLPGILMRRLGPELGAAFAKLDMVLANLEKGDVDAAVVVLESISERGERRERRQE